MNRILCVEDNDSYRELLVTELTAAGYDVDGADSPLKGIELVAKNSYDLVISDLKLPVMNGVTFMESVKNISPDSLGIILTGDPDEESELKSIRNSIDLYIEKSRSLTVILEYVKSMINTNKDSLPGTVYLESKGENLVMNLKEHKVYRNDVELELTPKEFEILKLFLTNQNVVLSREDFLDTIWQEPSEDVDLRLVDAHIKRLRDKIKVFSIMTVRGYGYKWNEIE